MADDLASKIGLFLATKVAYPAIAWLGTRAARVTGLHQASPGQMVLLTFLGVGGATYVSLHPEKTIDYVLGSVATVANTTGQVLNVAANQIRQLEKADLEGYLNSQVAFLTPYFIETADPVRPTLTIGAPPPLLPKDYNIQNFPYFFKSSRIQKIGDSDVDPLIEAYATLGIDVVSMILNDHQLPQMKLVKEIYLHKIKQEHPDSRPSDMSFDESNHRASLINEAYTRIKNLMKSADDQADLITPVLQYFHKGYFPPTPYIILFFFGGAVAVWLTR